MIMQFKKLHIMVTSDYVIVIPKSQELQKDIRFADTIKIIKHGLIKITNINYVEE